MAIARRFGPVWKMFWRFSQMASKGSESHSGDRLGSQWRMNPASLSVADLAALLSKAGGVRVTTENVQADIAAGAPTNGDGTLNLVHYAAWVVRECD